MILGMSIPAFLALHVTLSLIGIVAGLAVVPAMLRGRFPPAMTAIFLAATILTSATGFPLPPPTGSIHRVSSARCRWCCWLSRSRPRSRSRPSS